MDDPVGGEPHALCGQVSVKGKDNGLTHECQSFEVFLAPGACYCATCEALTQLRYRSRRLWSPRSTATVMPPWPPSPPLGPRTRHLLVLVRILLLLRATLLSQARGTLVTLCSGSSEKAVRHPPHQPAKLNTRPPAHPLRATPSRRNCQSRCNMCSAVPTAYDYAASALGPPPQPQMSIVRTVHTPRNPHLLPIPHHAPPPHVHVVRAAPAARPPPLGQVRGAERGAGQAQRVERHAAGGARHLGPRQWEGARGISALAKLFQIEAQPRG